MAKRLTREIHNPPTFIQLSAERLAWKLHDKLDEQDARILSRSADTIVRQAAALKEMIEAFRNYARAPSLNLEKQDSSSLVSGVLVLYEAGTCKFNVWPSADALPIAADTTVMRQVLHNLFKNAAEAAELDEAPQASIETGREGGQIFLTVCNNGKSFSKEMLYNAFEPHITDKPAGTGLGLSVMKRIIEEHGGRISLNNQNSGGVCVRIALLEVAEIYARQWYFDCR